MAKLISLVIGLNKVNKLSYDGFWDGSLPCCEKDADDICSILKALSYNKINLLKTMKATRQNVLKGLKSAAKELKKGDLFTIYYSGHGGQVPDINGDEADASDETWCLYDGQLIDDELYYEFSNFKEGVRIFVLSDSCHSGTMTKVAMMNASAPGLKSKDKIYKMMPDEVIGKAYYRKRALYDKIQNNDLLKISNPGNKDFAFNIRSSVKLISGCQDNQYSEAGLFNSLFTAILKKIWKNGSFKGNYKLFHKKICELMPPDQTPNLYFIGPKDKDFDLQRPFIPSK
ncbi:MAG TPA: caspase family protein [Ignavibacteria bacterium]|nr:caspase family protein [Ignavibacteria bacterium]